MAGRNRRASPKSRSCSTSAATPGGPGHGKYLVRGWYLGGQRGVALLEALLAAMSAQASCERGLHVDG
jgi:hypothetical protein